MIALGLLFLLGQDPAATQALDVVELKNGEVLQGRVLTAIDGFVELELSPGATVGFTSAQVAAIRRGTGATPAPVGVLAPRQEWFVLHDATGAAVGWLATAITVQADGGVTVNEEYEFADGQRRYQVTTQANADADGAPRSAYFRERISEPVVAAARLGLADTGAQSDRIADERIVEARCVGEHLLVQRLDRNGRQERELAWPAGASFPLLVRSLARSRGVAFAAATLFDPAAGEFVVRSYDGSRQRSVVLDGKAVRVTEVAETGATGRNSEWVDASARTLRRELAGPALVAVPSSLDSCKLAVGAHHIAAAVVTDAGSGFGLWLPNPAWAARQDLPAGQIAFDCAAHGATVSLSRLDHLEPGTPLDAAADAVASWFRLLQPELKIGGRSAGQVRDRATVQLAAAGTRAGQPTRACLDVIPYREHYLVFVCVAPERAWDELAADFDFLRRSLELDERAVTPPLQGPLAARDRAARPRPVHAGPQDRVVTPPAKAKAAPAGGSGATVRIPSGS